MYQRSSGQETKDKTSYHLSFIGAHGQAWKRKSRRFPCSAIPLHSGMNFAVARPELDLRTPLS